ncbi:ribonuclease H-like domain-containing protein [Priestia flexa]|uniref:Ribonuclease H-like domain-containing protein n=1 Tax=Priestia flexa TaxID=86664 RepID=A0ABU4JB06_9BACI|nr:ribonuclease H-like domain-containing protein [Priestia flexa]MCG7312840.1 ribonuclease H-like domain-containing protein [Priestia flexa]MDW8518188.1 ribonuclease H-like domain-containing protein [Priestia flexa]MED4589188.1 ribonuclease H-like domain-containing protein [Priestia flexa]
MSLKNKLNRMKKHLHVEEKVPVLKSEPVNHQRIAYEQQWNEKFAKPYFSEDNYCMIREVRYPIGYRHGHYAFSELQKVIEAWNKSPLSHPLSAKGHKMSDLFFFDTETTGLSTGTGTTIFLLGYAQVIEDEVIFRQHVLTEPSGEVAFYESFLKAVDYTTLVTYNGKSFDWPHVKTRHTLLRDHLPKLPKFGHFDLLHASRRLWKHKMDSVKLANVEKEVLGVERVNDVPGFLAPMIYFDFIESKNPQGLFEVMDHNESDILSLITLYIHLSKQLLSEHKATLKEKFEVARWYEQLGEKQEALALYEDVANAKSDEEYQAIRAIAFEHKRNKQFEKAEELFLYVVSNAPILLQTEAAVELAKLYEHKFKNYERGVFYAEKALQLTEESQTFIENDKLEALYKRINRVRYKDKMYTSHL